MFAELYSRPERLEQFMDAMSGISAGNFQALRREVRLLPLPHALRRRRRHRPAVDVRRRAASAHACVSADLPEVTRIAARRIAAAGLADRVSARPIDFFAEPLPKADVITMGMILHDWNLEKKMQLIRAAYAALPAGRGVRRDREPDRRRAARERLRADDVAEHADRVRRRVRLHRRRLRRLVPRGGIQADRGDPAGGTGERRGGVQMTMLTAEARKQAIASIREYFAKELELEIGDLKAGLVLDFFLAEVAPSVHNAAIERAQAYVRDRLADLDGACTVPEFGLLDAAQVASGLRRVAHRQQRGQQGRPPRRQQGRRERHSRHHRGRVEKRYRTDPGYLEHTAKIQRAGDGQACRRWPHHTPPFSGRCRRSWRCPSSGRAQHPADDGRQPCPVGGLGGERLSPARVSE